MIYQYDIDGLVLKTGDLICTTNGGTAIVIGQFWWIIGQLIPGDVDHIVVFVGPEGRCVEAGVRGKVITFNIAGHHWDASAMTDQRGEFIDALYGVAYPLAGKVLTPAQEDIYRNKVAEYCITQAQQEKPYNLNFLDSATEEAFYCSQLAYKAYQTVGIDLNTNQGIPDIPGTSSIIFPQEIWEGCAHAGVY